MKADELDELLSYLRGDLSPEERLRLESTLRADPVLRADKQVLEQLWLGLAFAAPDIEPLPGHRERFLARLREPWVKVSRTGPGLPPIPPFLAQRPSWVAVSVAFILMALYSGSLVLLPHLSAACPLMALSEGHAALSSPPTQPKVRLTELTDAGSI